MTEDRGDVLLADVALPIPVLRPFTYRIPDKLARACRGARVLCPVGRRPTVGVVVETRMGRAPRAVRDILSVIDDEPAIPTELLEFLRELAHYYVAPIGEVLRLALPPLERLNDTGEEQGSLFPSKRPGLASRPVQWVVRVESGGTSPPTGQAGEILERLTSGAVELAALEHEWGNARSAVKRLAAAGLVRIELREKSPKDAFSSTVCRDSPPELTLAQQGAVDRIEQALGSSKPKTFLLHGVTGSGKTEVYLRAIAAARAARRGAIVLVPEIALTPQLLSRYRARFGDDVGVLHSGLTARERLTMWRRLRKGEVDVAIGARSALFAPVQALGLVIVDEEHDSSFKQEDGVRYHARDMAILRAFRVNGVSVLGSATPSIESEHLSRTGRAEKLRLPARARDQALPEVVRIDLRRMGAGPTGDRRLSLPLHRAIAETLARGEQTILFLNRRGFAPSIRCEACGEMATCPSCSVALTFHKRGGGTVRCHYCGYVRAHSASCGRCGSGSIVLEGIGTEKLEETLSGAFPTARVARLDRDVASGKQIAAVLERVRAGEIDILVGTQMVTKGHDLPSVTLVGVINADSALSMPDFRATERAFQLLVQVAGRAGRGDAPGKVLVQTFDPSHPALTFSAEHDVDGFLERELAARRELAYPPFTRIILLRIDAVDEREAQEGSAFLAQACRRAEVPGVDVIGPAPAPLARLQNRFRYRLMLRGEDRRALRSALAAALAAQGGISRRVRVAVDVDPVQLL